jgi:beta-glucosidase
MLRGVLRLGIALAILAGAVPARAQGRGPGQAPQAAPKPWDNQSLSPDQRADLVMREMTLDEKIQLLHGGPSGGGGRGRGAQASATPPAPPTVAELTERLTAKRSNGGAGFIPGISRLGIPDLQMADAAVGVTLGAARSRYSTALPSTIGLACSWDLKAAYEYGALIGKELRDQGYNMSLGGGANITREPRNGRNFEYLGEDPILAGHLDGQHMKGLQAQGILGDVKHYAFNDQETGRQIGNVVLPDKRAMRESDLLAFEIAVRDADPAGVMCSYNKLNGDYACENSYLLNDVLKKAWGHKGFVLSDWGATHSTAKAALAGLDIEMPGSAFFGDALKKAVETGVVPMARIDDMVHRILRSEFAVGLIDRPVARQEVVDVFGGLDAAERFAEESIVLLKNVGGQLPLSAAAVKSIAVIGSHADVGVPSGGGSAQVNPPGGSAVAAPAAGPGGPTYYPSSPLKAVRAKAVRAKVEYNDGADVAAAAALAKASEIAIVFCSQPTSEGRDVASLALPGNQNALVSAVAAANPHTIVVLETGGPVAMPWMDQAGAVLEAWYPGIRGGEAIANILFGDVNPSAKTVVSFARSDADLPHDKVFGPPAAPGAPPAADGRDQLPPFDINYTEGLKVGYKWFDAENKTPLVPFGHGLSYTTFAYAGLKTTVAGKAVSVSFTLQNTGQRAGTEIAQVYVSLPAATNEPPKRLVAWERVDLAAGQSKTVSLEIDPFHLSVFNVAKDGWEVVPGDYTVMVGASSRTLPLKAAVKLP